MPSQYLVTFDAELSSENRRIFKDRLGRVVNEFAPVETAVSVDHLGLPVTDLNQKPPWRHDHA